MFAIEVSRMDEKQLVRCTWDWGSNSQLIWGSQFFFWKHRVNKSVWSLLFEFYANDSTRLSILKYFLDGSVSQSVNYRCMLVSTLFFWKPTPTSQESRHKTEDLHHNIKVQVVGWLSSKALWSHALEQGSIMVSSIPDDNQAKTLLFIRSRMIQLTHST